MKKLFIILSVVLSLALAGNVMALDKDGEGYFIHSQTGNVKWFDSHPSEPSQWRLCEEGICGDIPIPPESGEAYAYTRNEALALDRDFSISATLWWGNWNDYAFAKVEGYTYGMTENSASAEGFHKELRIVKIPDCEEKRCYRLKFVDVPNEAFASGLVVLHSPEVNAWSWAKDYGLTSKAGAGAKVEGDNCDAFIIGKAKGVDGDLEWSYSVVGFGGEGFQLNRAGETDYNAGFAVGGNESGFMFYAEEYNSDEGQTYSFLGIPFGGAHTFLNGIEGSAITKGKTEVSIDPYGMNRSAYAHTENVTNINISADVVYGSVYGFGNVAAFISNGGSFAQGSGSFGYQGSFSGSGQSTTFNQVKVTSNGVTAISSSVSSAVAD